jgi:hypothetical protein
MDVYRIDSMRSPRRTPILALPLPSLTALGLAGCERVVPTTELETRQIRARLWAFARGPEETIVRAYFLSADRRPDALELGEGDQLWAEIGGRRVALEPDPELPSPDYIAHFPAVKEGERCRFGLERRNGVPATNNFGVFPAPFHLVPIEGRRSRSQALEVRWTPAAGDPMEVEVYGGCVDLETFEVPQDRGRFTVPAHSLQRRDRSDPDSCEVDLTVRRIRAGRTDPALHATSSLLAEQERRVKFVSVP